MIAAASRILLVGCGKMGGAILQRLSSGTPTPVCCVVDPAPTPAGLTPSVTWVANAQQMPADFTPDLVVLAIKPQHMAEVLPSYAKYKSAVFLSIAAGVTIERIGTLLGSSDYAIVRSMPNLPASIGHGVTAAVANNKVSTNQRAMCQMLLEKIGKALWLDDEALIDAVTALSGSGPAYVFALCEAMERAGAVLGLSPAVAQQLARETIAGSGALLSQSEQSATDLRVAVTSPGGTTEAALKILNAPDALPKIMLDAMGAAKTRAIELSGAAHGKK